mmetsp:Transcript_17447/g.56483  ORF Transcript_17447/g.56483 Transcript_17447/m.56483 type:complete len:418 (-) Transcript_17447:415-1668(-)
MRRCGQGRSACDVVDKVLMRRETDVRLTLGFHCVVNRSQKNIDDGMEREELWKKEGHVFESDEQLRGLPKAVRVKLVHLRDELRALPAHLDSEADQYRLFNSVLRDVRDDLQRRVRAEFVSSNPEDGELTIAPRVADLIKEFRARLQNENPEWLGRAMIDEVDDTVQKFMHGYTVDTLMGPQVFINLIKRVFVEDGLLRDAARVLVDNIASHLRIVVSHVVDDHAGVHMVLASQLYEKALDVIDIRLEVASKLCDAISEAQQVTSTTHGGYMVKLREFRKSWFEKTVEDMRQSIQSLFWRGTGNSDEKPELTAEFLDMVQQAQSEPQKFAVLEICASLHVYTSFLIDGFVDMIAKVVKFNMVENIAAKLEDFWRNSSPKMMKPSSGASSWNAPWNNLSSSRNSWPRSELHPRFPSKR